MQPLIAIVGRPNVGKSTLFNRLLGHRSAIVHDMPGVTRDRHYGTVDMLGHMVRLVDTGGFAPTEQEGMLPLMREQAQIAIDEADAIIFLGNGRDGVTGDDAEIAAILRRTDKPVLCVANKCDTDAIEMAAMDFYSLGCDRVLPIAAEHNRGILDLIEAVIEALQVRGAFDGEGAPEPDDEDAEDGPEHDFEPATDVDGEPLDADEGVPTGPVRGGVVDRIRVSFVGRPNVGKSTLINKILGSERVITADMPGTTRDAIDIEFQWQGEDFTLVDTAGLRRKRSITHAIEQYSVSQAVRAIERSHVAVLVLDASQPLTDQDSKVAALVQDRARGCVIAINKWDAIAKETMTLKGYEEALKEQMPFLAHLPTVFLSARTGQRVDKLFEVVAKVYQNFNLRIGTGELNRWLVNLQLSHQPPTYRGKKLRMYYAAQVGVRPPQFVIQVNTLGAISPAYERFLMAQMREKWDLLGAPIKLRLKKKAARRSKVGAGERPGPGMPEPAAWFNEEDEGDFGPEDEEMERVVGGSSPFSDDEF